MHLEAETTFSINLAICFKYINDIDIAAIICHYSSSQPRHCLLVSAVLLKPSGGIVG